MLGTFKKVIWLLLCGFVNISLATSKIETPLSLRLAHISGSFLGAPYVLTSLGDGPQSLYDQQDYYRTDAFDCETFVTTVLALTFSDTYTDFRHKMRELHYQSAPYEFTSRNHFTEVNWNPNNEKKGFIKDITLQITDLNGHAVGKRATAWIDQAGWYRSLPQSIIRLKSKDRALAKKRLKQLIHEGQKKPKLYANVAYIPLDVVLNNNKLLVNKVLAQIPNGAVIEIVRMHWDIEKSMGTPLLISHMGFAFWKKDVLYFREASSLEGKVIDIPLIDYLKLAHKNSPSVVGINIHKVCINNNPEMHKNGPNGN